MSGKFTRELFLFPLIIASSHKFEQMISKLIRAFFLYYVISPSKGTLFLERESGPADRNRQSLLSLMTIWASSMKFRRHYLYCLLIFISHCFNYFSSFSWFILSSSLPNLRRVSANFLITFFFPPNNSDFLFTWTEGGTFDPLNL